MWNSIAATFTGAAPSLSQEETQKAQQMVSSEANDDEFKDALEEEEVEAGDSFPVSQDELGIIRAELASDFPEDYDYLSDAYILSVASKPYSKNPSVRRPLEVSHVVALNNGRIVRVPAISISFLKGDYRPHLPP